jgi:dUTPase
MIKVKKLHEDAQLPVRNTSLDAGADVFSVEDVLIPAGESRFIDTGIALQADGFNDAEDIRQQTFIGGVLSYGPIPSKNRVKSYLRIAPRSGLAFKHTLQTLAGVVDLGYQNSVKVGLLNSGKEDFQVSKGMKIAQIIREVCILDDFELVEELENSDRNLSGFGSSGN